jgi:hypothetical protein
MVAIDEFGRASPPSRILGLTAEDFCMAFDVDGDGSVTVLDVLVVLQRVVHAAENDDVTVSDAYEILTLANAFGCEELLAITEARAGAGRAFGRESALRAAGLLR